ncbi:MAG: universal stress protein [Methylococcales bacterium]|nr:universal stress protein [Methylococcales bacterium]
MSHYRHILLATDFSKQGDYVADKAKALADTHQAKLSIVHVIDNIPMPDAYYGMVISLTEASDDALLEAEKAKLINLSGRLNVDLADCCLLWGIPKQEIINIAKQQHVDLIVVGSHGRHGLALLLGSTANSILHYAKCDVLAVRLKEPDFN